MSDKSLQLVPSADQFVNVRKSWKNLFEILPPVEFSDCATCSDRHCCRLPEKVRLSNVEVRSGFYDCVPETSGVVDVDSRSEHLMYVMRTREDGNCVYLSDGKCTIYEHRPHACRIYDCRSQEFRPLG